VPQALVHFLVGLAGALLVVTAVEVEVRHELPLVVLSGVWALAPDGHRFFRMAGVYSVSNPWQTFHRSRVSNLFWFHHALDGAETGIKEFEIATALVALLVALGVYYAYNEWDFCSET